MDSKIWSPKEIRKTVLFILGIILIILGVILIFKDVKAEGAIKLDLNLFKGEIKSGSAGLLLIFFAFFFIVLSSVNLGISKNNNSPSVLNYKISTSNKILLITIGLILLSITLVIIDLVWIKIYFLAGMGGFLLAFGSVFLIVYLDSLDWDTKAHSK